MSKDLCTQMRDLAVPPGSIGLCALGQAGFLLRGSSSHLLAIDPYLSDRLRTDPTAGPVGRWTRLFPPPFSPGYLDVDCIVVTHEHGDHFDPATIGAAVANYGMPVIGPPCLRDAVAELHAPFIPAFVNRTIELGTVRIHPVPAAHAPIYSTPDCYGFWASGGGHRFLGYVMEVHPGVRVYHSGDTILHPDIARSVRSFAPTVAILPVNGRDAIRERMGIVGNLTVREAAGLATACGARILIPSHHDLFAVNGQSLTGFRNIMDSEMREQAYRTPVVGTPILVPCNIDPVQNSSIST